MSLWLVITTVDYLDEEHIADIIDILPTESEADAVALAIAEGRYPGQENFTAHDGVKVIEREIGDGPKIWAPEAIIGLPHKTCDECGAFIPDVNGGGLANRHHLDACSLFDKDKE